MSNTMAGEVKHHFLNDSNTSIREPVVAVGHASAGDSCYVPVVVEGVHSSALVDMGSTVTVVRPNVVPEGMQLEPTCVQLQVSWPL